MARPAKVGEKKENVSVSVTRTQREYLQRRARLLGFPSASNYLLALHEAEQRLKLETKADFNGQRWWIDPRTRDIPEDKTLEQAIQQRIDDEMNPLGEAAEKQRAHYGPLK